ncbi:MAG: hypothetical protein KA230_11445 [Flavobacteriales bacterium]|nr:hypothetical protein [Flavobacteriales bacterium]
MKKFLLPVALLSAAIPAHAQDDLLAMLNDSVEEKVFSTASWKSTRVINGHSTENTAHGVLDFRIGHRFGFVSDGISEFFGLDGATVRLGFDYGITDRLQVGFGRSGYQKTIDGSLKYKILRQCGSGCGMPITLSVVAASSVTTLTADKVPWYEPGRTDYFTHRLAYSWQLLIGRKFSEGFTLQLMPGLVHRNLVQYEEEENDVINIGAAARYKLSKRLAVTAEYYYVLPDQLAEPTSAELAADPDAGFKNSLAIGLDIETGGHVFQLHFSNSTGLFERAFITETVGSWAEQEVHFGFNISRVFTLHRPKRPM